MTGFFNKGQTDCGQTVHNGLCAWSRLICSVLVALSLAACSGTSTPPQPDWSMAEKGIRLTFRADSQVNFYDDQPHTVTVAVYQLAEPAAFNQLLTFPSGIQQVLIGGKDLPASLAADHFYLQPGENIEKVYDRAEGAKWVVVAAGFFAATPQKSAVLEKIEFEEQRSWLTLQKNVVIQPFVKTVLLGKDEMKLESNQD